MCASFEMAATVQYLLVSSCRNAIQLLHSLSRCIRAPSPHRLTHGRCQVAGNELAHGC